MSWWNIISPSGSAPIGSPFSRMLEISMIPGSRARELADLAEIPGDADQVFLRQVLTGKDDDEMVEPGLVDGAHGLVVGPLAQIEPANFRPDMLGQRNDLEPRSCQGGHGISSAAGAA